MVEQFERDVMPAQLRVAPFLRFEFLDSVLSRFCEQADVRNLKNFFMESLGDMIEVATEARRRAQEEAEVGGGHPIFVFPPIPMPVGAPRGTDEESTDAGRDHGEEMVGEDHDEEMVDGTPEGPSRGEDFSLGETRLAVEGRSVSPGRAQEEVEEE